MSLITNLIAYYKLDGNSNDATGTSNGSDTSISYSTSYGKIDQGASLNGTTSKVLSTISSGLGGSFTVNIWAYKVSGFWNMPWYSHVASYNNYWACIGDNGSGKIRFQMYDGTNNPFLDSTSTPSGSAWHMITTVRNTTTDQLLIYIDGVLDCTPATDTTTSTPTYSNFYLGTQNNSAFFNGYLDECGVWSRALTSAEIQSLYGGGFGYAYPLSSSFKTRQMRPALFKPGNSK